MKRRTKLTIAVGLSLFVNVGSVIGDDTYPTEVWPGSTEIAALNGTTDDETGLVYIEKGTGQLSTPPLIQQIDRLWHRLARIVMQSAELRMVKTDDLKVGCFPGEFRLQGTDYHYAGQTNVTGADGVAFSDGDDTYYLWLDSTNALRMATDATGWPSDVATFIPLAEVTVASSDITAIKDVRNRVRLATIAAGGGGGTGTDSAYFTLDQDNTGAGVDVELRANRGTTANDAALRWDETADEWVALADRDTPTRATLEALIFESTQTTGTAPLTVASTTNVTNLNADAVDGIDIGTLTAAGGAAYAHSTSEIRATAAGDSGDVLISNGAAAPQWDSLADAGIQGQDDDLDALAGVAVNGLFTRTAAGTAAARTITAGDSIAVTNGSGVAGNPTIAVSGATENAIQIGAATGALADVGPGTDDTVLVGRTGNTPTFRKLLNDDIDPTAEIAVSKLACPTYNGTVLMTGWPITDSLGFRMFHAVLPTPSGNVLSDSENEMVSTNEAATSESTITLTSAIPGLRYSFVVQDSDGIKIQAVAGDTIRIAGSVSASAGYVRSSTVGDTICLQAINGTEWVAMYYVGTWTIDS